MLAKGTSLRHRMGALAVCSLLATACDSSGNGALASPPVIESFTSASSTVFVGERTLLTAVFNGDSATIDGIGLVQSGTPVATPAIARATTFTLIVRGGSQQVEARVTVAAIYRDRFRELAPSPVARTEHLAVALADGGALVMGGFASTSPNVPDSTTSERFDPVTETFSPGPDLSFSADARFTVPAALEGGGILLVGGGINSSAQLGSDGRLATQAFDPTAGRFARVGDLSFRHSDGETATTLDDGTVLVAGGQFPAAVATERYDPATRLWTPIGDMITNRRGHTATRLADGRVLIAGGVTCCVAGGAVTRNVELYDPSTGTFEPTGSLATPRALHAATLLTDGRVLVTGGFVDRAPTTSTEIYDPSTGRFDSGGDLGIGRSGHSAILLDDGRVLVLGGHETLSATDLFDPATNRWSPGPTLQPALAESTATLLASGKILVVGGDAGDGLPVATVRLYE